MRRYETETEERPAVSDSAVEEADQKEDLNLIEMLTILASQKWLIAKVTGVGLLVGLVASFVVPVRYTAVTRIMPPQQTQSTAAMMMNQLVGLGGSSLAAVAGGGLGLKNPNDIYVGLLNSRTIADAIIDKYKLLDEYHASDMTKARKKLTEYTEVKSEKSGLIAVSFTDRDRQRAADVANDYTMQLRTLTKSLAMTEAQQRMVFYEDQLKQSKDALLNAAMEFQKVQQQHGMVQLDAQARAMIESLAALRAQVTAKEVEVQTLRAYSTDKNPQLQLVTRELASLRAEEDRLEGAGKGSGPAGLGLGSVPTAGLEYLRAQHELQYQQALYDMLMKQYDAARLDESKEATIIQVVEPAIRPDRRSSPKRTIIVVISTAAGLIVGCILAWLFWKRSKMMSDPKTSRTMWELKKAILS